MTNERHDVPSHCAPLEWIHRIPDEHDEVQSENHSVYRQTNPPSYRGADLHKQLPVGDN